MAQNLAIGETVYVPATRLGIENASSAFLQRKVVAVQNRSVQVDLPGNQVSEFVATSVIHRNVGFFIVRIGDYSTEFSLLDPLAASIVQYFNLLVPGDMVDYHAIRSVSELRHLWQQQHAKHSHVILIGHGRQNAVYFGVDEWVGPDAMADVFTVAGVGSKNFVSLCCKTGYAAFSQAFSRRTAICDLITSPFHSVHGAIASQYCQTLFAYHLLQGETFRVSWKHARDSIPGGTVFRLWEDGEQD